MSPSIPPKTSAASCPNGNRSQNLLRWINTALRVDDTITTPNEAAATKPCPSASGTDTALRLAVCLCLIALPLHAHDAITTKLTWTQEISRLVNRHCVTCHREAGPAFSLTVYAEARPWAKAIRDEVLGRRMPPWGPVKGVGDFHPDPSLSLTEIDMFVAWVEGGAPEGDPALLPTRLPPAAATPPLPPHRTLEVASELTLKAAQTVLALRPVNLQNHQSLEAWATQPDGTVHRLIWLKDYRAANTRDYRLRTPLRLPKGTKIQLATLPSASLALLCK